MRLAVGGRRLVAVGGWRSAVGGGWWRLAGGGWWSAVGGGWRVAVGGPWGFLRTPLTYFVANRRMPAVRHQTVRPEWLRPWLHPRWITAVQVLKDAPMGLSKCTYRGRGGLRGGVEYSCGSTQPGSHLNVGVGHFG